MKKFLIALTIVLINPFIGGQAICLAAEVTSQTQVIASVSTSSTQSTSQNLVDSHNTLLALATTTTTTAYTSLVNVFKSDADYRSDLNKLYGTSFSSSGPTTTYDTTTIQNITSKAGYSQTAYLASLTKTTSLYKAIQALSSTSRQKFNTKYGTYIPASGSPMSTDRTKLFGITAAIGYDRAQVLAAATGTTVPATTINTSMIFGASSFWNAKLSSTTGIDANSYTIVSHLVAQTKIAAPWFNTAKYSTPYYIVDSSVTPKVSVSIVKNGVTMSYTKLHTESIKGVPIPAGAVPAAGTDGHITIYDKATDKLYEYWQLKNVNGKWQASWGGILANASTSNGVMPTVTNAAGGKEAWGATATGLSAIGGTIFLKDLKAGKIPHALALAIPYLTKGMFKSPATRTDGYITGGNSIPAGTRFKFPASVYIDPSWSPLMKMMVTAIRDYGVVLRDTAGAVTFFGEDPKQYGSGDPYAAYYGGQPKWSVMTQFPWSKLQVIK